MCKCKKRGMCFNGDSKNGTGNLHRHLKNCKQRSYRHVGQMISEKTSSGLGNRLPEFDVDYFREILALAIVEHGLPFQFAEYKGVRRCFNYLHPDFKAVTRNTIKSDVLKITLPAVALVLDPRYKIHYVQWSYKMIYGDGFEYELEFSKVKDAIRGLYDFYASTYSSSSNANLKTNASEAVKETCDDFM
uniref:hAT-like transposase RNase-H fold domain-containing protein n=1 Tax=Chenopodium quinoa TaxID=63459 RepID=A0A803MTM3_CHEQI